MSKTVEKLDTVGEQSLQWLEDFTKKGVEFVQEQAPDLCREIINLGLWQQGFLALMWLCIGCITIYIASKLIRVWSKDFGQYNGAPEAVSGLVGILSVTPLIGTIISLYNFVSIYAAPKIYLINYFATLYRYMKG